MFRGAVSREISARGAGGRADILRANGARETSARYRTVRQGESFMFVRNLASISSWTGEGQGRPAGQLGSHPAIGFGLRPVGPARTRE